MNEKWSENIENGGLEGDNRYDASVREAAWNKMEQLLDQDAERKRPLVWWWLIPAILLIFGGAIFTYYQLTHQKAGKKSLASNKTNHNSSVVAVAGDPTTILHTAKPGPDTVHALNRKIKVEAADQPQRSPSTSDNNPPPAPNTDDISQVATTSASKTDSNINTAKKLVKPGLNVSIFSPDGNKERAAAIQFPDSRADSPAKRTGRSSIRIGKPVIDETIVASGSQENDEPAGANEVAAQTNRSRQMISAGTVPGDDSVPAPANFEKALVVPKEAAKKSDASDNKQKQKNEMDGLNNRSRFSFGILGAADISSVNWKKTGKLSTSYGILLSYRFAKRWSIYTGVSFAKKLYLADSTNYKKMYNSAWNPTILKIDANCKVIEIPINLQYLISRGKSINWYANAGLSSYFMKKESYDYTIFYNNIQRVVNYSYSNKSNQRLAILNLGVDLEKNIKSGIAVRVSPFWKLPLTGIGVGAVSLQSAGLQAAVTWTPSRQQVPKK